MKNKFGKLAAIALGLTVTATAGAIGSGCGNSSGDDLQISVVKLGYGTEWLEELASAFEAKTGNTVTIKTKIGSIGQSSFDNELESKSGDTDIFFTKRAWFAKDVYSGQISVKGNSYDCLYADLSDVWNSVAAEGESKTIKEKMDPTYADALNIEGKYYNLPWAGGVYGIVRNKDVWAELNLTDTDVPYTTDELFALCDKVKKELRENQKAPFMYSSEDEYYTAWSPIFFGQYEGRDAVNKFMSGQDLSGKVSKLVYSYDGHLEAMKVLEQLLDPANGYQHGATSVDFTTMQGYFLQGKALFCVNGSWLENEMKANYPNANVDFIKTPVVSAIVDRLSFASNDATADDAKLKEVIKYVDAVDAGESPEKPAGVSDADIKIVTEARHYSYMAGGVDHRAYVPAYSDKVSLAKDFLKFMYSDEGLNIYYKSLDGTMLPAKPTNGYNSDGVTLSSFRVSSNEAQEEGFVYDREPKSRFFVLNNLSTCYQIGGVEPVKEFTNVNGKSAKEVMESIKTFVDGKWTKFDLS